MPHFRESFTAHEVCEGMVTEITVKEPISQGQDQTITEEDKKKKQVHAAGAKCQKWQHGRGYTTMILRWKAHVDATNYSIHYHRPLPGSTACRNRKKRKADVR